MSEQAQLSSDTAFNAESEMMLDRRMFAPIFKWTVGAMVSMICVTIVMLILLGFVRMDYMQKIIIVRLLQVSFGMVIGAACVILGVVLSWMGVTAAFAAEASAKTVGQHGRMSLVGTSPGILLILGGVVLISVSLYRPVEYREQVLAPAGSDISNQPEPGSET